MSPVASAVVRSSTSRGNGFPGTETERRKVVAATILRNLGVEYGPNKINRLVLTFAARVERNGFAFLDFLTNALQLDAATRRRALADPDIQRVISYVDQTGETAVRNVLRGGGRR